MTVDSPAKDSVTPRSNRFRLRWDVLQFVVFVLLTAPHATGLPLHEWAGLALAPILVVHLAANWDWIVDKTRNVFRRQPGEVRFNHIWNTLMFVVAVVAIMSGILCSRQVVRSLGFSHPVDFFWAVVHSVSATVLIALVGVHLGMHFRWVIAQFRRSPRGCKPAGEDGP